MRCSSCDKLVVKSYQRRRPRGKRQGQMLAPWQLPKYGFPSKMRTVLHMGYFMLPLNAINVTLFTSLFYLIRSRPNKIVRVAVASC